MRAKKILKGKLKEQQFDKEALFPIVSTLVKKLETHQLSEAEFVAAYIISFLHKAYPKCLWLTGFLPKPIQVTPHSYPTTSMAHSLINRTSTHNNQHVQQSTENKEGRNILWDVIDEHEFFSESDKEKIKLRFLKVNKPPTLLHTFQYFSLRNIPPYVNECIVNWGAGKRPAKLLFYIPTAQEILKLQCEGKRCVTAFITKEGLTAVYKDPYPPFEEKDALRFLLHDLQHMEKFVDPKFYCEQVGFLNDMRKLFDNDNDKFIDFSRYTKQFAEDVDHVISDMNACCIHLFAFFKAKWKLAQLRYLREKGNVSISKVLDNEVSLDLNKMNLFLTKQETIDFDKEFKRLLASWNIPQAVIDAAMELCQEIPLSTCAAETIRKYYHHIGEQLLGIHFDLIS